MRSVMLMIIAMMAVSASAWAQSSSLLLVEPRAPQRIDGQLVNPSLQNASYTAVIPLPPREFALHDLVTIVVRESSSASSEASLDTEKKLNVSGSVTSIPTFDLSQLLQLRMQNSKFEANGGEPLKLGITSNNKFEGDGEYERKDEMVFRITARVVDVKPNGTLALEARKFTQNDNEKLTITLNGYCRAEDVAADNTVLSTQMFDLRVTKEHTGELRNASKKGFLTKVIDFIFSF